MKSVLPIAAGILGVGALIYFYMKQRDKDKKKKPDSDINETALETLEFKVENSLVPLIVGRNSVNLKSIEEKTKTHIKFRESDGENQICSINGYEEDVKIAKELIDAEAQKQPIITDEILLPTTTCGKIEGYGGSILHDICQKSSAKVWVDPGVRKTQGENRRVLITGVKEQVELAKKLLEEMVKESPVEQSIQNEEKEKSAEPKSLSPFPSNSSITTTESPREIMLPSPEKLKNNYDQLEVYVSAVASPSRFWVQICGPQTSELDFLVDFLAMTEYYNLKENQILHAIREPYLGQIVAAMYLNDNKWYRAEIVAIEPNSDDLVLDVYFLDYGDQQFVGRKDILELRADFLSLRFQAIECFLAHVQPVNTGSKFEEWDRKSIEKFESLVQVAQWKKLISKVVTYKERKSFATQRPSNKRESSPIPGVELYEDNSERNIALELVQSGYAEMSDRFGDLAKSSVLTIIDDKNSRSKEATPEPKEIATEPEKVIAEPKEVIAEPKEAIAEPEKVIAEPKEVIAEPKEAVAEQFEKAEEDIDNAEQISLDKNAEIKVPEAVEQTTEIPKEESEKIPFDNNNDINFNPQSFTNGKPKEPKHEQPESSNTFNGSDTSKFKIKNPKKKKQATADFLKEEQQSAAKKYKSEDWNAMMED